jgi:hypothetical protein
LTRYTDNSAALFDDEPRAAAKSLMGVMLARLADKGQKEKWEQASDRFAEAVSIMPENTELRIPINSPAHSDPISPAIPISNRPRFRFQIARGKRSFRHVDFLALVTVVGQPFLVCFPLVRRMLSPARSMRWAL